MSLVFSQHIVLEVERAMNVLKQAIQNHIYFVKAERLFGIYIIERLYIYDIYIYVFAFFHNLA